MIHVVIPLLMCADRTTADLPYIGYLNLNLLLKQLFIFSVVPTTDSCASITVGIKLIQHPEIRTGSNTGSNAWENRCGSI
jgi:hypothetical protein